MRSSAHSSSRVSSLRASVTIALSHPLVPALAAIAVLIAARRLYPRPRDLEATHYAPDARDVTGSLRLYILGASLIAAGYADFPLIAYHFGKQAVMTAGWIPGSRHSQWAWMPLPLSSSAISSIARVYPCSSAQPYSPRSLPRWCSWEDSGGLSWGWHSGASAWGARVDPAGPIATLVPPERRGSAYGLFNAAHGIARFLGSALMGHLYDRSLAGLVALSVLAQLGAIPLFVKVAQQSGVGRGT